jgi:hypothetical protein
MANISVPFVSLLLSLSLSLAANLRDHKCPPSCGELNCPPQFRHNCDADSLCTWCACTGYDCVHIRETDQCVLKTSVPSHPSALFRCDNVTATRSNSEEPAATGCSSDTECHLPCPFVPPPRSIVNKCVDGTCKCVQQNGTANLCGNLPGYFMTCASVSSRAWPDMCCDGRYAESLASMCTNPLTAPVGFCRNVTRALSSGLFPTGTLHVPTDCNPDGCQGLSPAPGAKDGDECVNSAGSPFEGCRVQQGKCCNDRQSAPLPTTCKNGGMCAATSKQCRCSGCTCCDDECNIEMCDGSCGPCC